MMVGCQTLSGPTPLRVTKRLKGARLKDLFFEI
jgi:hypothetical protein